MPLRRTERGDGRQRPRWKDGSHVPVETRHADESRCDGVALEPNLQTEPLVGVPPLLGRNHELELSTRERPANTGADARIEESAANGEVCLALRPYGRTNKPRFCSRSGYGRYVECPLAGRQQTIRSRFVSRKPRILRPAHHPILSAGSGWLRVGRSRGEAPPFPSTRRA